MSAIDTIEREARAAWRPPKKLTLSEWADAHAYLSAESSAQEGRWRTLPYQKGLMDAMTDPAIEMVVFQKSARVGYTKCLNNLVGYHIHQDPCPIMLVQPTDSDAEGYSKEEIAPMLRDTPVLRGLVAEVKSRDSNNTILNKSFPGGVLSLVGANSPRGFRRVSRRVVLFDEVDGYPPSAGSEGDQIKLGIRRSEFYWNRKIVAGSTPTTKESSRIERMFLESDQRRYFVPCPHCGAFQYLKWPNIKWPEGNPWAAYYECEHCQEAIEHSAKYEMIQRGEWRATAEPARPGLAGFHIWAAYSYSPNATWGQLAAEFVEAKDNPELLKTFVNTALGETWEESYSAKLDAEGIAARAEAYDLLTVPDGGLVVTAGVDVQDDRIEIVQRAWGVGEESWLVNRAVIYGDPSKSELWDQALNVLNMEFKHATGGRLKTYAAVVDSGGHFTHEVYAFARQHRARHILAGKGMSTPGKPALGKPTKQDINIRQQVIKKGAQLWPIGTDTIKSLIYGRLRRATAGAGAYHWPLGLPPEYFSQLTAEKQATRYIRGFPVKVWVKKDSDRNEALDCEVYCYAAMQYVYTRHNRATFWEQMASRLERVVEMLQNPAQDEPAPAPVAAPAGKVSLSGWRRGA